MKPSPLSLERLEFSKVAVTANPGFTPVSGGVFTQLDFDFKGINISRRARLRYPPEEAPDPKHFFCVFGIKILQEDQKERPLPYEIDIEVSALFTYLDGSLVGADRFRAVRFSAYQMLYGALREMIATVTARSRFGLLQLPSADFRQAAKSDSESDEAKRQETLAALPAPEVVIIPQESPESAEATKPKRRKASRKLDV
ncbi:hypothetical protein [Paraburkholderia dilworthii]|uniref:Stringent starvation protein B n=1 Tax=Paraburkholderia dilworthii TaxID=948106 RepID=A0ABW9DAX7_9BURK